MKYPEAKAYKSIYDEFDVRSWQTIEQYQSRLFSAGFHGCDYEHTVKLPINTVVVYYPQDPSMNFGFNFFPGSIVLYMGEISGCKGQCLVATEDGQIRWKLNTSDFRVIPFGQ